MAPDLLLRAIELATASVAEGGGPFGALVARDGEVVATGANRVVADRDPTAHAEVLAIRAACAALGTHDLSGCELYASCEPCPMCLGAVLWSHVDAVHFAATAADAAHAGFDDAHQYREVARPRAERELAMTHLELPEARRPFDAWAAKTDRTAY